MSGNDLPRRARKILQAVVTEYLQGGDAVGSRTVTRRHDLGLSPATVRNVMADLEELGLLQQPHSSSGRVPTQTGLRFFIDSLLKVRGLSPKEKDEIRERVSATTPDEVVHRASRLLADLTQHAAVIVSPDPDAQRLERIEFVPLRDGKLIAVLVTTEGRIENRLVVDEVDAPKLERIHNYLNNMLAGMTLDEIRECVTRELGEDKNRYDDAVSLALKLGQAVFLSAPKQSADVVVTGSANLLNESFAEPDRTRELLRTLEDKQTLIRLLDRTRGAAGIQVFLGAETAMNALSSSSVVAMPFGAPGVGEHTIGALAVIGPMRMNYGKVMSVVDFTADAVSQILAELGPGAK